MASAWAAGAIGDFGLDLAPSSLAHGVAQGGIAELGGGDFRSGFWAGAIGHAVSGTMQARGNGLMTLGNGGMRGIVARTAIAAVAGGTVSVLGGGKFANGAKTAAFVHLFNAESAGLWRKNVADIEKLEGLSDEFRPKAESVLKELADDGHKLRVIWGERTKEQNQLLVDQGKASPTSRHLSGDALDFVNRKIGYDNVNYPDYNAAVERAASNAGVKWGGDFKSRWDPNHIELK